MIDPIKILEDRIIRIKEIQSKMANLRLQESELVKELDNLVPNSGYSDRIRSRNGEGLYYNLLNRYLPCSTIDTISKKDLIILCKAGGESTSANNFDTILSQHLNTLKKNGLAHNPERGKWKLTSLGVKIRNKKQNNVN